jgi:UDP-N-acetylglucosamine transferase subunit ALG13
LRPIEVRLIIIYGKGDLSRLTVCPVKVLKILKISKNLKFKYREDRIVCGGTIITSTTQANQNFFRGKLNLAKP